TYFNKTTKKQIKRVNDKTSETITGTSSFTYSVKQYVPYNLAKYNNTALTSAITGFSFSDTLKDGLVIDSVSDITVENMTGTDVTSTYFNITLSSDKRTATATLKPAKVSDTTFYGQHYIMKIKAHAKSGYTKWTDYLSNGKITVPNTATTTFTRGSGNDSKNSNTVNVNLNIPVTVNYQIVGTAPSEAPAAPASETKNIGDAYTTKSKLSDGVYNNKKCTFSGWNTKNDNGTLSGTWTNGTALKENLTLYGKWNCADPVIVNYNITSTDNPPVSTISINKSKPDNVGVGTVYVGDKYTAEPELTTTWKKKKCTFTGWTTDNTLNTKWAANTTLATTNLTKNASIDGYELNLYGGWSCEKLVLDPTKTVNDKQQIEIEADEKFTFTITHNVPNITDSHFYYDKYVVTDQLEPALKIREVDIKDKNGSDLNDFFTVTIAGQKVTITANNDYLANPSFYNQTYNFMIIASKRDGADLTNYLQTNGEYEIPNKAAIEINEDAINKTTLETNEVKLKVKKFDIKYHVIGDVNPPANLTDPLPADTKALSGSAYNQENKLTTTYIEKKCTFNGWYLDEGFTKKWIDGDKVNSNLDFYGSWQCDNVVNDINKTATLDKIVGTQNFEYTIYQTVPNLEEAFYYKNYEIIDALEPVLETEKDNINVYVGETKVTDKFNIEVSGQTVTITAKDTTSADFYNKEYKYVITVNKKDGADLTDYQEGDTYIIPNKAHLKVKTAADTTEEKDSNEVKKEIGKVTVDYQIIGTNNPDSSLTDPIPSSVTFLAGEKYKAASPLTTRYTTKTCTFNGWYTDTKLQNKYQDDSVVNEDMTLYGSWDCIEIVNVPPTSSFVSKVLLVIGVLLVAAAAIMIYTTAKEKKVNQG
ncbi:MAG: isopeptide-forming domain-containing fimbrial protein, partial [Bacilli bacterium]|nr:isopeptide-forming domain-containing fimbrial protein [Bacilli bacterium]